MDRVKIEQNLLMAVTQQILNYATSGLFHLPSRIPPLRSTNSMPRFAGCVLLCPSIPLVLLETRMRIRPV
jgi:hypothetical protein